VGYRVALVYGTRPEAIKFEPLDKALRRFDDIEVLTVSTHQHSSLLDDTLLSVGMTTDIELAEPNRGSLTELFGSMATHLAHQDLKVDLMVVQGDTLSAFLGALSGYLAGISVVHLEAGLRTSDLHLPHPEEGMRRAIGQLSSLHLAPTTRARRNLESEGVTTGSIVVTGNTSIDALHRRLEAGSQAEQLTWPFDSAYCVVTVHRRENWGATMEGIAQAVAALAEAYPDIRFICPLHPNPAVRESFAPITHLDNVHVIDPIPHESFASVLQQSLMILTDSGGIQEESTVIGVPTVILRVETERPEAVEAGSAFLAGTDASNILRISRDVLERRLHGEDFMPVNSPFGDGKAAHRAADAISCFLRGAPLPDDLLPGSC